MKDCVIIIPIYHPDGKWNECLRMLKRQRDVDFDLYLIDSGSERARYEKDLEGLSYHIEKTTPEAFDHGGTREAARVACADYPFLVYMTQDAIPSDEHAIRNLLQVFEDPDVAAAYGRQLPHKDATHQAACARAFNYPEKSRKKTWADAKELGLKVSFISDTFAAYRPEGAGRNRRISPARHPGRRYLCGGQAHPGGLCQLLLRRGEGVPLSQLHHRGRIPAVL